MYHGALKTLWLKREKKYLPHTPETIIFDKRLRRTDPRETLTKEGGQMADEARRIDNTDSVELRDFLKLLQGDIHDPGTSQNHCELWRKREGWRRIEVGADWLDKQWNKVSRIL